MIHQQKKQRKQKTAEWNEEKMTRIAGLKLQLCSESIAKIQTLPQIGCVSDPKKLEGRNWTLSEKRNY